MSELEVGCHGRKSNEEVVQSKTARKSEVVHLYDHVLRCSTRGI